MKWITLALALSLVLCGCASQPTATPTAPTVSETSPATEPAGIYDAESTLEAATDGAVRVFPLGRRDSTGIALMGADLLLFSGTEKTNLTIFRGEDLRVCASADLNCTVYPSDPAVQVSGDGITYYDEMQRALVFLDAGLQEVKRHALPENICGAPALSADRQKLYYCTDTALRCLDLSSGLDRLVKEMHFRAQRPTALHCDDAVVACSVEDDYGNLMELYISAETGLVLEENSGNVDVWTRGSFYFAACRDHAYQELLTGDSEQGPTLLTPHTYGSSVHPVLELGGAVLISEDSAADTLQLDYYDLQSGKRTASLTLLGLDPLFGFHGDAAQQTVWFLRYDPAYGSEVLCRWELAKSAVESGRSCLSTRYTAGNPDYQGLAACRATADRLSAQYGVQILLWTDASAFQPWDYTLVPEYQVPLIREELKRLEAFLALYPEGFLKKAAELTGCGSIQICLVRSIQGNETAAGALQEAVGLQYWDDNKNAYLSLAVAQDKLVQNACHEMFHIIESRVLTLCRAYDDWAGLNPKGFQYDYDYEDNLHRKDDQWLSGGEQAFIDRYSMSFPKEDRARIMEYAMTPGNEHRFESETMQKKLRQLCIGIREAFGLKDSADGFLWEQYLNEPLT